MRRSIIPSCALLLAAAGAMTLTAPGPATAAEPILVTDPANDVSGLAYLDIQSAVVTNSPSSIRVTYTSESFGNRRGEEVVWLDTNARRPGPELELGFGRYSEGWVKPMRDWKRDRSASAQRKWSPTYDRVGRCDRTVRINSRWEQDFSPVTVTVRKKKGCIDARRVRVHISTSTDAHQTSDGYKDWPTTVRDEFPDGRRTFTDWTVTGSPAHTFSEGPDRVHWWNDLRSVGVERTESTLELTITTNAKFPGQFGAFYTYLDTNGDSSPDYRVLLVDAGGGHYLSRMSSWDDDAARDVSCSFSGSMTQHWDSIASFSLPISCIGNPSSLRVAMRSEDFQYLGANPIDWLGGTQAWTALGS